jgi:hypothetical protein
MIAKDIISRAQWEVGDELNKIVQEPEMVKTLDRVYRDFCLRTKLLRGVIGFKTVSGTNEYQLYGTDEGGIIFGDNFFKLYRVEYDGQRMAEVDTESARNSYIIGDINSTDSQLYYAIDRVGSYKVMIFPFNPSTDSEVVLWYYEIPRIGTISNINSEFNLDSQYIDELSIGLAILARKRIIQYFIYKKEFDVANQHKSIIVLEMQDYEKRMIKLLTESKSYSEEITPIVQGIADIFEDDNTDLAMYEE